MILAIPLISALVIGGLSGSGGDSSSGGNGPLVAQALRRVMSSRAVILSGKCHRIAEFLHEVGGQGPRHPIPIQRDQPRRRGSYSFCGLRLGTLGLLAAA